MDIVQIVVNSFVGALVILTSGNIIEIGDNVPFDNLYLIVAVSVLFSYVISYMIGVRRLGKNRIRMFLGVVPERTFAVLIRGLFWHVRPAFAWSQQINNASRRIYQKDCGLGDGIYY